MPDTCGRVSAISSPRSSCDFFSTSASPSSSPACLSDEVLDLPDHRGQVLLEQIHIPDEQTGDAVLFEQLALDRRLPLSFLRIEPGVYCVPSVGRRAFGKKLFMGR